MGRVPPTALLLLLLLVVSDEEIEVYKLDAPMLSLSLSSHLPAPQATKLSSGTGH